ncbi:hypothetical protein GCM10029964_128220 [Kibdelosporangium lantanae]
MSAQPEWTLEAVPDRPRTTWNAAELMAVSFPEPTWAVPGIIAEGVTLLAGPPKVGKSWLSLGLGLSIAAGLPALGTVAVDPGPVLYLALEDTPRRLQSRMRTVLAGRPAPAGLTLDTYCPPLPTGETITSPAGWTKTPAPVWSSSTCSPRSEATPRRRELGVRSGLRRRGPDQARGRHLRRSGRARAPRPQSRRRRLPSHRLRHERARRGR